MIKNGFNKRGAIASVGIDPLRRLVLAVLLFMGTEVYAQTCLLMFEIEVYDNMPENPLEEAEITLYQDGELLTSVQTDSSGKVHIDSLPVNHLYRLTIEKEGFVAKCAEINTFHEEDVELPHFYRQPLGISLFRQMADQDFSFLLEDPMIEFSFDDYGILVWNKSKLRRIQKKVSLCEEGLGAKEAEEYLQLREKAEQFEEEGQLKKAIEELRKASKIHSSEVLDEKIRALEQKG